MKNLIPRQITAAHKLESKIRVCDSMELKVWYSLKIEKLKRLLSKMADDDEIIEMVSTNRESKQIDEILAFIKDLNFVNKCFQKHNLTIADVHAALNEFIKKHPSLRSRLGTYADIILYRTFESAIAKIQESDESEMTPDETLGIKKLLQPNSRSQFDGFDNLPLGDRVINLRRIYRIKKSNYVELRFMIPSYNLCERLFWTAGFVL